MIIPFLDLHAQYLSIKNEIDAAIQDCIKTSTFIGGSKVKIFEEQFASFIGTKHCVSCANGTDAIEILLKAMGIGPGDEVIVPAMTWISSSEAVSNVGAQPMFVDIHPEYYTIDVTKIEAKITAKTKAIIPVHLYGLPCEMDSVLAIAKKYRLKVLEDCAQAHGAKYKGRKAGTMGDAASFSFYPGKNLGAYGDAGGMVTNDDAIASVAKLLTNHGQLSKHDHRTEGRNSRLDAMQAAVLSVKLKYLDEWNSKRRELAKVYGERLKKFSLKLPTSPSNSEHVYHLYVIQINGRDRLIRQLEARGIGTAIHYPCSLPFMKPYAYLNHQKLDFPVVAIIQEKIASLPLYPELAGNKIDYLFEVIASCMNDSEPTAKSPKVVTGKLQ